MSDFFLHHKCGYTFDQDGTIAALTPVEERRLWRGFALWNKEIENREKGQEKPGRSASPGDRREFEKFANEVNSNSASD